MVNVSGAEEFGELEKNKIRKVIESAGFVINEKKWQQTRDKDGPEITGLLLKKGKPDLSDSFIKNLKKDIDLFHELCSERLLRKAFFNATDIATMRRSIKGQINFVSFVKGDDHKLYHKLRHRLEPKLR